MNEAAPFQTWESVIIWLREQPDQRELVLAAYYDDPLIDAATRYWQSDEWGNVRTLMQKCKGRALDVGAGRGIASFALAKDGFSVTALEPDGSALVGAAAIRNLAKVAGLAIDVSQDFSERLPFPDSGFDVIFARAVLHHTKDLKQACREFLRVLKPGGVLVAVREHVISCEKDLPKFLELHPLHRLYGGENAFLLAQYTAAISEAGFQLEKVLTPFESVINFAPHTQQSLQAEIAQRIGRRLPGTCGLLTKCLSVPLVWSVARRIIACFDHRPGRLYSFIARRPTR